MVHDSHATIVMDIFSGQPTGSHIHVPSNYVPPCPGPVLAFTLAFAFLAFAFALALAFAITYGARLVVTDQANRFDVESQ